MAVEVDKGKRESEVSFRPVSTSNVQVRLVRTLLVRTSRHDGLDLMDGKGAGS